MNNLVNFSEHFCEGEEIWSPICFECEYPSKESQKMYFINF